MPHTKPCATILGLPVEIMNVVFVMHRDAITADTGCAPREAWSFLELEAVCKLWHNCTNANQLLWTRIALPAPAGLVMRALDRSGDLALDITLSYVGQTMDDMARRALCDALPRTRSIALAVSDSKLASELYSGSPFNTARLEMLAVGDSTSQPAHTPHILQSIHAAPRLHTLDVYAYPGVWADLARFVDLKSLAVRKPEPHFHGTTTTVGALTAVFRHHPALEDLDLFCNVAEETPGAAPLPLPHLRRLRLTGRAWCTAAVLRALAFPRRVRVLVDGPWVQPQGRTDFGDLYTSVMLEASVDALTGGERIAALQLALTRDELVIAAFTHPAARDPRFTVRISEEDISLHGFLDALPLDDLCSLTVTYPRGASRASAEWLAEGLASVLSRVQTLRLHDGGLAWLRQVLAQCHALRTLELVGHAFPSACTCGAASAADECFHALERALAACCSAASTRLPELRLVRCNLPDGAKGLFVPHVEIL